MHVLIYWIWVILFGTIFIDWSEPEWLLAVGFILYNFLETGQKRLLAAVLARTSGVVGSRAQRYWKIFRRD